MIQREMTVKRKEGVNNERTGLISTKPPQRFALRKVK
jgi:hypothetical protein